MLTWKLQDSPLDYLFFRLVEHEFDLSARVMMKRKMLEEEKVGNQSFSKIFSLDV